VEKTSIRVSNQSSNFSSFRLKDNRGMDEDRRFQWNSQRLASVLHK
jgi:hypothetical protein